MVHPQPASKKEGIIALSGVTTIPIEARTFRVFVSSTFEDLKEERYALQRPVFPRLQKLCEQHKASVEAVDLWWGVRPEAPTPSSTSCGSASWASPRMHGRKRSRPLMSRRPGRGRLRRTLSGGWPSDDPRRTKYEASATHQEILQGLGKSNQDRRHVFVFCRKVPNAVCEPDLVRLKDRRKQ
jgi:hypothetical protein